VEVEVETGEELEDTEVEVEGLGEAPEEEEEEEGEVDAPEVELLNRGPIGAVEFATLEELLATLELEFAALGGLSGGLEMEVELERLGGDAGELLFWNGARARAGTEAEVELFCIGADEAAGHRQVD